MKLGNLGRRFVLPAALLAAASVSSIWAEPVTVPFLFPGVDAGGNLSNALGTNSTVKANVNTNTGRFTARGTAKVQNLSGAKQTFTNVPVNVPDVTVNSSRYTVTKAGKATATASGIAG